MVTRVVFVLAYTR